MERSYRKMMTRDYQILPQYSDLSGMNPYFAECPEQLQFYKDNLLQKLKAGRSYQQIGEASRDSLYELETLCIGTYTQGYVLILDFSQALDYILHRLYRCKIEDIRRIEGYNNISASILNYNFDRMSSQITFERLLNASDELLVAISALSKIVKEKGTLSQQRQVQWMIFKFYSSVLSELHRVKYYSMMMLCASAEVATEKRGVIRSSNYSSIVATISHRIEGVLTIHQNNNIFDDYEIPIRSYLPFEYLGEVVRKNVSTWQI